MMASCHARSCFSRRTRFPPALRFESLFPIDAAVEASSWGRWRSRAGGTRLDLDLGPDGADAEGAFIDAWRALGQETTEPCCVPSGRLPACSCESASARYTWRRYSAASATCTARPTAAAGRCSRPWCRTPGRWGCRRTARRCWQVAGALARGPRAGWTIQWDEGRPRRAEPEGWLDAELAAAHPTGPMAPRPGQQGGRQPAAAGRKPPPRFWRGATAGSFWPRTRTIRTGNSWVSGRFPPRSSRPGNAAPVRGRRGWLQKRPADPADRAGAPGGARGRLPRRRQPLAGSAGDAGAAAAAFAPPAARAALPAR